MALNVVAGVRIVGKMAMSLLRMRSSMALVVVWGFGDFWMLLTNSSPVLA